MAKTSSKSDGYFQEKLLEMHRSMLDIRNFDNKVNRLVKRGVVPG